MLEELANSPYSSCLARIMRNVANVKRSHPAEAAGSHLMNETVQPAGKVRRTKNTTKEEEVLC